MLFIAIKRRNKGLNKLKSLNRISVLNNYISDSKDYNIAISESAVWLNGNIYIKYSDILFAYIYEEYIILYGSKDVIAVKSNEETLDTLCHFLNIYKADIFSYKDTPLVNYYRLKTKEKYRKEKPIAVMSVIYLLFLILSLLLSLILKKQPSKPIEPSPTPQPNPIIINENITYIPGEPLSSQIKNAFDLTNNPESCFDVYCSYLNTVGYNNFVKVNMQHDFDFWIEDAEIWFINNGEFEYGIISEFSQRWPIPVGKITYITKEQSTVFTYNEDDTVSTEQFSSEISSFKDRFLNICQFDDNISEILKLCKDYDTSATLSATEKRYESSEPFYEYQFHTDMLLHAENINPDELFVIYFNNFEEAQINKTKILFDIAVELSTDDTIDFDYKHVYYDILSEIEEYNVYAERYE